MCNADSRGHRRVRDRQGGTPNDLLASIVLLLKMGIRNTRVMATLDRAWLGRSALGHAPSVGRGRASIT